MPKVYISGVVDVTAMEAVAPPQVSPPIALPGDPGWGQIPGFTPGTPPPRPQPQPPLGIWGPTDPRPSHPIAGVPGQPPLGIWGPTDPRPTPPIYIPIMPPAGEGGEAPTHPIYIPVYPSQGPGFPTQPIYLPPGSSAAEVLKQVKEALEFWTGNLPTDPSTKPEPVK